MVAGVRQFLFSMESVLNLCFIRGYLICMPFAD
jgi:hypothetical protein